MSRKPKQDPAIRRHRLKPAQLRWRCDARLFPFRTTREIGDCPIRIIGQPRALEALRLGLSVRSEGYNLFVSGRVGGGRSTVVRRALAEMKQSEQPPDDLVFVHNFRDPDRPRRLSFPAAQGIVFREVLHELMASLESDLPQLFESDIYTRRRTALRAENEEAQKALLKEFEREVEAQGFSLVQVQSPIAVAPQLLPVREGEPVELEQLEAQADEGKLAAEELEAVKTRLGGLRVQMESLGKQLRKMDRQLQRRLTALERDLALPLVGDSVNELRTSFESEGLDRFLEQLQDDILESLDEIRETAEPQAGPGAQGRPPEPISKNPRYRVNVLVDNSEAEGLPIIWETAPTYRNLFGTIDAVRTGGGDWATDHTRIKAGSLLRANGGILIIDALDALVEPGVWTALKRTLRTCKVEIQLFDPLHMVTGFSIKPEPVPIDVKVVMIGTPHIYRALHRGDEDFKKIFKVKADLALQTPLSEEELNNYACFVHKKVEDDDLRPFHREAVAAVVEQGVRLAGHHAKLTTRFAEIADLIRESAYWAAQDRARWVRAEHVDQAIAKQIYRVDLIEEMLRERITDGSVLIDLAGKQVGQVNGLAVLDLGDHAFALPSRITATTAMGRAGVTAIDREAEMSGTTHTKGVLILTGFLRSRFAQDKPLTLSASLCFEQNYGPIDGDSASSTELYALLSNLSGVPIDQGIAVTGSVNQRGEVQPIGGANEKIEGYFDLCRVTGLSGTQGVMIPSRNLDELMLRKDLVKAVKARKFHVWAVSTIEEGLQVLTGVTAGKRNAKGRYPADSIFGRVDAELTRLAEGVTRFGIADRDLSD